MSLKKLHVLVLAALQTDTEAVRTIISENENIAYGLETDIEHAIELAGSGAFELLVLDKNLPSEHFNKLKKLADVFFPDMVVASFNFSDVEFIRYKLQDLYNDWKEAQSPPKRRFLDNLSGF